MKRYWILLAALLAGCAAPHAEATPEPENIIIPRPTMAPMPVVYKEPVQETVISPIPTPYRGIQTPEPIDCTVTARSTEGPGCCQYGDPHKINGYYYDDWQFDDEPCNRHRDWIRGIPTFETQFMQMPDVFIGEAWGYGPNLMEHTAKYRWMSLKDVVDGVALPACGDLGELVWLKRPGQEWEGPFRVVDCAALTDLDNVIIHRGEAVEVGFETAIDWEMVKGAIGRPWYSTKDWWWDTRSIDDVIVSKIDPELLPDDHEVVDLEDWYADNAVYFETQEERDCAYRPIQKIIDYQEHWKFCLDCEFITMEEYHAGN